MYSTHARTHMGAAEARGRAVHGGRQRPTAHNVVLTAGVQLTFVVCFETNVCTTLPAALAAAMFVECIVG
ncbi:hypothetical protein EON67_11755 [archaeon]|nr:MAG: hypothetical protein EON67_11755 [archaeon]